MVKHAYAIGAAERPGFSPTILPRAEHGDVIPSKRSVAVTDPSTVPVRRLAGAHGESVARAEAALAADVDADEV